MSKASSDEADVATLQNQKAKMDTINIRYGESRTYPIDTGDVTDVTAEIYIGKPGQSYVLAKQIVLTEGKGVFLFTEEDTALPLDTYYYQINTIDGNGYILKFPEPSEECGGCETEFPKFIISEALDVTEVS